MTISESTREKLRIARRGRTPNKGYKHSAEIRAKWSRDRKGEGNPHWKGGLNYDKMHYGSVHRIMRKLVPKPEVCQMCKKAIPTNIANISGKYHRVVTDWQWLCVRCHVISDGRINNVRLGRGVSYKRGTVKRDSKTGRWIKSK